MPYKTTPTLNQSKLPEKESSFIYFGHPIEILLLLCPATCWKGGYKPRRHDYCPQRTNNLGKETRFIYMKHWESSYSN